VSSSSWVNATTTLTRPDEDVGVDQDTDPKEDLDPGYVVICWDDPVNLMAYVTHVFRVVFGWPKEKAEHHMLEVHHQGRSALIRERLEKAEYYVHRLHQYGLHATLESPRK